MLQIVPLQAFKDNYIWILDIPGQPQAHIGYYGLDSLFCGDTPFACGCGARVCRRSRVEEPAPAV